MTVMAARVQITSYVPPDLADALRRVAAVEDRSISDIIEDAIARRFQHAGRDGEHAALMARLESLSRRLGVLEKGQETHFELTAQAARFTMSLAPEIPEESRAALSARGGERLRNLLSAIVSRLTSGRSFWRDMMIAPEIPARGEPAQPQSERAAQ